jgi:hypothetical protein
MELKPDLEDAFVLDLLPKVIAEMAEPVDAEFKAR